MEPSVCFSWVCFFYSHKVLFWIQFLRPWRSKTLTCYVSLFIKTHDYKNGNCPQNSHSSCLFLHGPIDSIFYNNAPGAVVPSNFSYWCHSTFHDYVLENLCAYIFHATGSNKNKCSDLIRGSTLIVKNRICWLPKPRQKLQNFRHTKLQNHRKKNLIWQLYVVVYFNPI